MTSLQDSRKRSDRTGSRYRRPLVWTGGILLTLALLFVLVVFVLPSPTARYVIEYQLDRLQVQHGGVDTVDIDLWNSRVRAGPVQFRSGDAEDGEIGEAGFEYSFAALFEKHAFIRTFFLSGVDIRIERQEDGLIKVNGIDLARMAKDQSDATDEKAESGEKKQSGFGAGVENFEFTDSQISFHDFSGGSLTIDIDRLTLHGFRSWEPETAGTFVLLGTLNGIELEWSGNARPLADPITIDLSTKMRGITIDRVAGFIGPTGLDRQAGSVETQVHYEYAIHSDYRVEGKVDGTYTFSDFDIATADGEVVTLQGARLDLDLAQEFDSTKSSSSTGTIKLQTSPLSVVGATGDAVEVGEIAFTIDDLSFNKLPEQRDSADADPTVDPGEGASTGSTPTIVQLMIGWAEEVANSALRHHLEIDGRPAIELKKGLLRMSPRDGNPGQELRFETLSANLGAIDSQAVTDGWTITAALELAISGIRAASEEIGSEAKLAETRITSQGIDLKRGDTETTLDFDLALAIDGLDAKDGSGLALALRSLETGTTGMTVIKQQQGGEIKGPFAFAAKEVTGTVPSGDANLSVAGKSLSLNLPQLALAGQDAVSAAFSGRFELNGVSVEGDGTSPVSFGLATLRSDLENFRVEPVATDGTVEGAFSTAVTELYLALGQDGEDLAHTVESIETRIDPFNANGDTATMVGTTKMSGMKTTVPIAGGEAAETTIASLELAFTEVAVSGETVRSSGGIEARGVSTKTSGDTPQSIDIESISVEGLNSDPQTSTDISAVTIEGLVASINDRIIAAEGENQTGENTEAVATETQAEAPKPLRIGDFSISAGSRIEVTDTSVDPPIRLDIELEKLRVGPIDTNAPDTRTQVEVNASVNETASADIQGWLSPLKPKPDFDLTAKVTTMPLPPFSPFAASAVGVEIDSGELTADVQATASSGDLSGQIDVLIDGLYVEPVSEEHAKGLESSLGVPVGFAVGILKNDKGQIDLGFPVSGTVDSPKIDYSGAISKAVTGAMASVFPTNWFGKDGKSFGLESAIFEPGTAELTEEGKSVTDAIGELFADREHITVRTCGKATAADLIVLRGGKPAAASKGEETGAEADESATKNSGGEEPASETNGAAAREPIAKPTQQEVDALLALATARGKAVRRYLSSSHGIDLSRILECRTSYSIEDGKPPRAEFRL